MTKLVWDMNGDGIFSISDVWLILKWFGCLPGNFFMDLLLHWMPGVARFFEINTGSQYGDAAWLISIITWFVIVMLFAQRIDG